MNETERGIGEVVVPKELDDAGSAIVARRVIGAACKSVYPILAVAYPIAGRTIQLGKFSKPTV